MSFAKSFLLGLVVFLGLNVVFFLIFYGISGTLIQQFTLMTQFYYKIFEMLAMPVYYAFPFLSGGITPSNGIIGFLTIPDSTNMLLDIMFLLGILVPPIVAALITGRLAENKLRAFLSWMLISIILSVLGFLGFMFGYVTTELQLILGIIYIFILGAIFTIFYGFFALAANKSEFY